MGTVVTTVASFAHASGHPLAGLIPLGVAVAAVSVNTTLIGALVTAAQCWALYDGFLLGRAGVIVFDLAAGQAAAALLMIAVLCTAAPSTQWRQGARYRATCGFPAPTGANGVVHQRWREWAVRRR